MIYLKACCVYLVVVIIVSFTISFSVPSASATTDCDRAQHLFFGAQNFMQKDRATLKYLKAIELCPGFIRPYELVGNYFRKEGKPEKAIEFFTKAAELGSVNYKLYYLLASLFYEKGDLDMAHRHLNKSLNIRSDYPKALSLKLKIERASDTMGPQIKLYEPSTPHGITVSFINEIMTVRGVASDKSGVAWLKINNQKALLEKDGRFLKDVPLNVGLNNMEIEAEDKAGNRSTLSVTVKRETQPEIELTLNEKAKKVVIERKKRFAAEKERQKKIEAEQAAAMGPIDAGPPGTASEFYRKSFAVVVGINNYEKWPVLELGIADAQAIKARLKEEGFDDITVILDREATQRRILTALYDYLPKKVQRNDRVVFYFAGHGQTHDLLNGGKEGYIIPVDAGVDNYTSTGISMDQIRSLSSRIAAKHILYIMDSCYSGLGFSRGMITVSPEFEGYLRKISSMRVVQIITAGGKGEQVQEKEGHGLFTAYFLKALEGDGDFNKDTVVTGTELGAYLRPAVSNASNQAQTPLYGRLEGEGEFLFFIGEK